MIRFAAIVLAAGLSPRAWADVAVAPAPPGAPVSKDRFSVEVRQGNGPWRPVPVYDFFDQHVYNHTETSEPHLAVFQADGEVSVRVTAQFEVREHIVRPLSRAIPNRREGNAITLTLNDACRNAVVETNGEAKKPLLIFTSPLDPNPPEKGPGKKPLPNGGVYYGPGHYLNERIEVREKDWPVVYIAPGAVVDAHVSLFRCSRFTLAGGGILYCRQGEPNDVPLKLDRCSDGEVRDVTISSREENWTVWIHACRNVAFQNARVLGEIRDGIDPINSQFVTVVGCYIQAHDDATSIKGLEWAGQEPIEHILFQDCIMNNQGGGWGLSRCLMEQNAPRCRDIRFRNCDVIHALPNRQKPEYGHNWTEGVFQIRPLEGKTGGISQILLDGIRVEDAQDHEYLIEIAPDLRAGSIRDVTIRDVRRVGGPFRKSLVRGRGQYRVSNVNFSGLYDGDRRIEGPGADVEVGPGAEGVTFAAEEKWVDPLADLGRVHEKSEGWRVESATFGRERDASRVTRSRKATEFLTYRFDGLAEFTVRAVVHLDGKPDLLFKVSADGRTYREVKSVRSAPWSLGGGWSSVCFWADDWKLAGANYLRLEIPEDAGAEWAVQLCEVELVRPKR